MRSITPLEIWMQIGCNIKERVAEGDGFWRSCSGCYETEDGQNVHEYPQSDVFDCVLGGGCSECGGIGAVWDSTDYDAMASELVAEMDQTALSSALGKEE